VVEYCTCSRSAVPSLPVHHIAAADESKSVSFDTSIGSNYDLSARRPRFTGPYHSRIRLMQPVLGRIAGTRCIDASHCYRDVLKSLVSVSVSV